MNKLLALWQALPEGVRKLAIALALVQLVMIALHLVAFYATLDHANPKGARGLLDFNQEGSLQTYWSAVVMTAAGAAALEAGSGHRGSRSLSWVLVGLGFIWIGAEELVSLHEDIQVATGIDWPLIYFPALVVGCWAIVTASAQIQHRLRPAFVFGLGCLVLAVGAELLSSPSIAVDYNLRNLLEENLELAGATLVLLVALAHGLRPRPQQQEASAAVTPQAGGRFQR